MVITNEGQHFSKAALMHSLKGKRVEGKGVESGLAVVVNKGNQAWSKGCF